MTASALVVLLSLGSVFLPGPPYEAVPVAATEMAASTSVAGFLSADLDGDGVDECAAGVLTGILVRAWRDGACRASHQFNLPPRFLTDRGRVELGPAWDVDGDGRRDLVVTAMTRDGWEQRLLVLDLARDRLLLDVELPTGPDLRADGVWDGSHNVIGVVEDAGRTLAVLERRTQYDRLTRAVVARDLHGGGEVWSYATAGNPFRGLVTDLDADGRSDILVGIGSGDNLRDGEHVGGRRDDEAWILALRADGSLLWEQPVAGRFAAPRAAACDLDGDGSVEVVVYSECSSDDTANRLLVVAGATGEVLATEPAGPNGHGLHAWRDGSAGEGAVVCLFDDGRVRRYVWRGGRLLPVGSRHLRAPTARLLAADILPEPGPEFAVFLADGQVAFLSADLRTLAAMPPLAAGRSGAGVWNLGRGSVLFYPNEANTGQRLVAVAAPRRYAGTAGAGALVCGAGAVVGTLLGQRRRLRRLRRISRLDLLRAFLTSRHGTVGPVGVLERVMWSVENPAPDAGGRLSGSWEACRREAVPDLEALLEKAAHVRLDPPLLAIVRRELATLVRVLDDLAPLAPADRRRPGLTAAARTSLGLVADGVKSLGATLAASCRLDPLPVVQEVVRRHAARRPGLDLVLQCGAEDLPTCHADAGDLEFAVDNLLDNAARHAAAAAPRVTVRVASGQGRVTIAVADNGPGVPAADRERIFAAGGSSRAGGGVGLWHSREALRYYGGDVAVEEAPAGGARFVIILRTAAV